MILAPAALHTAPKRGIGGLDIVRPEARGLADILGTNHVAATHDHDEQCMLLRMTCKLIFAAEVATPAAKVCQRNSLRTTSFSPDQVSSTAQTLVSTKPNGSASSRMVSSVMSVRTFAACLGQLTHT